MYFKEKEDTNIDKEFEKNKKNGFSLKNIPSKYFIIGGIIIFAILAIIVIILLLTGNKNTIELIGEEKIIITKDSDYIEPGYKAYDKKKNDITNQVQITSNVDTSKVGEYEILYSINGITEVRYVTVIEGDTYIYLKGKVNMYLEKGEKYTEPGYQVFDSVDQNLTEKVKVSGTVNTSKVGSYQIIYSVVNSRNITVTEKRTIVVVEKGQKPNN